MTHRIRLSVTGLLAGAAAVSAVTATPAVAATTPGTARLGVALRIPSQHLTFTGTRDVNAPIDAGNEVGCVVTNNSSLTLRGLRVRIRLQSTTLRDWRVAPYAKGPATVSGTVFDLGTVAAGSHKTLVLTYDASTVKASTLAFGCTPISAGGVRLVRPHVDTRGDAVAARFHATSH